jgi:hypothetical protein
LERGREEREGKCMLHPGLVLHMTLDGANARHCAVVRTDQEGLAQIDPWLLQTVRA